MTKFKLSSIFMFLAFSLSACSEQPQTTATQPTTEAPKTSQNNDANTSSTQTFGTIPSKETAKASYIVVSQPSYPPFASRNEAGNTIGLDIDMLTAIAAKENIHLEFLAHDMEGLLETLNTGKADIVATGVNITEERQKVYDFSKPYMEANWVVLIDGAKDKTITNFSQLQDKPIAVQQASLSETYLQKSNITKNPVLVKTIFLGLSSMAKGEAIGVYDVDSVLNTYIKPDNHFYTVVDSNAGKIPFGFVLKKGNTELKAILDKGIDDIKADGTYDKILQKWYPATVMTTK